MKMFNFTAFDLESFCHLKGKKEGELFTKLFYNDAYTADHDHPPGTTNWLYRGENKKIVCWYESRSDTWVFVNDRRLQRILDSPFCKDE